MHSIAKSLTSRHQRNEAKAKTRKHKKEAFQSITPQSIYFLSWSHSPQYVKIGYSSSFYKRIETILTSCHGQLFLLALLKTNGYEEERNIHKQFHNLRLPGSEWFLAKAPLLQFISSLDQSMANQSLPILTPYQQSRITIPPIDYYIDLVPFL